MLPLRDTRRATTPTPDVWAHFGIPPWHRNPGNSDGEVGWQWLRHQEGTQGAGPEQDSLGQSTCVQESTVFCQNGPCGWGQSCWLSWPPARSVWAYLVSERHCTPTFSSPWPAARPLAVCPHPVEPWPSPELVPVFPKLYWEEECEHGLPWPAVPAPSLYDLLW